MLNFTNTDNNMKNKRPSDKKDKNYNNINSNK